MLSHCTPLIWRQGLILNLRVAWNSPQSFWHSLLSAGITSICHHTQQRTLIEHVLHSSVHICIRWNVYATYVALSFSLCIPVPRLCKLSTTLPQLCHLLMNLTYFLACAPFFCQNIAREGDTLCLSCTSHCPRDQEQCQLHSRCSAHGQ